MDLLQEYFSPPEWLIANWEWVLVTPDCRQAGVTLVTHTVKNIHFRMPAWLLYGLSHLMDKKTRTSKLAYTQDFCPFHRSGRKNKLNTVRRIVRIILH